MPDEDEVVRTAEGRGTIFDVRERKEGRVDVGFGFL